MKRYLNITLGIILLLAGCSGCNSKHQTESFDIQSDSITKIGSYSNAVPSKTFIRNLVFHTISDSTAEVLGEELFEGSPESITIPSKVRIGNKEYIVTQIGFNAFSNYENLKNVELPPTITSILKNAFYGCSSLVDVEIPSSVTFIGDQAFMGCNKLTHISIPSNVTSILPNAFSECINLELVIDNSKDNIKIDDTAFNGCKSVKYLR